MKRTRLATLRDIARVMKYEAYVSGKSEKTLSGGLQLTLEPYKQGWKLTMQRGDTAPSKNDYKVISRAFFNGRVQHLSKPSKNALELVTVR